MKPTLTLSLLLAAACTNPPTQEEIDVGTVKVGDALDAVAQAQRVAELLGFFPEYTCGEPRGTFVGKAVDGAKAKVLCLETSVEALADKDVLHVTFKDGKCVAGALTLEGSFDVTYSGGESSFAATADLSKLKVNGVAISGSAGYATCGDEQRYFVQATGPIPDGGGRTFSVDAKLAKRPGIPVFGATTLVLDGTVVVDDAGARDQVTFTAFTYEVGAFLPKSGALEVNTAGDVNVKATFRETLWRVGEVELVIDGSDATTVPVVQ